MAVNFPLYYVLTLFYNQPSSLGKLRLVAMCFSILLVIFYKINRKKQWLAWYWLFTVMFCLPFFFSYNVFQAKFNTFSVVSLWTAMLFAALVLDVSAFFISLFIGMLAACVMHLLINGSIDVATHEHFSIVSNFVASVVIIAIFSHSRSRYEQEQLRGASAITSMLAHELRTPLMLLSANMQIIKQYFPELIKTYKRERVEKHPADSQIHLRKFEQLEKVASQSEKEIEQAQRIISVISAGTQFACNDDKKALFSIRQSLCDVIKKQSDDQRQLVNLIVESDFKIHASPVLVSHVFDNLFRNAFYAIRKARKGRITVTVTRSNRKGIIIFEDTALGMSKSTVKFIFNPFYTTKDTKTSSGLGLYYCRQMLERVGATIRVESREGYYMRFIMKFKPERGIP